MLPENTGPLCNHKLIGRGWGPEPPPVPPSGNAPNNNIYQPSDS